jgi:Skp family chaperone for outer membrane proteins
MDSLTEDGASLWTELKIGAINLANTAIKPLIKMFSSLASYIRGTSAEEILTNSMTDVTDTVDDNGRFIRKDAISSIPNITVSGTAPKKKGRSGGGGKKFNPASIAFNANKAALAAVKPEDITGPSQAWEAYTLSIASSFEKPLSPLQQLNKELEEMRKNLEKEPDTQSYQQGLSLIAEKEKEIAKFKGETKTEDIAKDTEDAWKGAASAMASVGSAMASIEDPTAKTVGIVMQAIATVAQAFSQALSEDKTTTGNIWAFIAAALASTASMVSVISSIHSATGYAQGGIVTGNSYSGDNIPIMANAQEVVLTRAMAGNLASQLEGNGLGNLNLTATVSAEQIRFTLNNNGRRTGRGEFVQTNSR